MQLHKLKPDESRTSDGEPVYLTPATIERLQHRLTRLKKTLPDAALEAARTAAYGDRSDNAEYKEAKGSLRRLHGQIFRIENQLKHAVPIETGRAVDGKIKLGATVTLETGAGARKIFQILGPYEADPTKGRISYESPLGAALLGHMTGEIVSVTTPNGAQTYRIIEIG